jgi:hypothetical protein
MTRFYMTMLYIADWRAWIEAFIIGVLGGNNHGGGTIKTLPRWGFYHRDGMCEGPRK